MWPRERSLRGGLTLAACGAGRSRGAPAGRETEMKEAANWGGLCSNQIK
jgi:hypothetical protein